jgi:hypothetical protein
LFRGQGEHWVDAECLQRDLDGDACADELLESVFAYGGELLPGFYDKWVILERKRLRAIFDGRTLQLVRALLLQQRWRAFARLQQEQVSGLAVELEIRRGARAPEWPAFRLTTDAKIAPAVITVAALVEATGKRELLAPLEHSLKCVIAAGQLLDDWADWERDLEADRPTTFLLQALPRGEQGGERELVQRRIGEGWLDVAALHQAARWLDEGAQTVSDLSCPEWLDHIGHYRAQVQRFLEATVAQHLLQKLRTVVARQEPATRRPG